jgi:hypothetical protein
VWNSRPARVLVVIPKWPRIVGRACIVALLILSIVPLLGQATVSIPTVTTAVSTAETWMPPRTPWGDPDLQGVYTNNDENLIPLERPTQFEGKRPEDITESELADLRSERSVQQMGADARQRFDLRSPRYWSEDRAPHNSRAWLIVDLDGTVPPVMPEAVRRVASRALARRERGPADSWEDRSLWERCITRGLPGSMMPEAYGNAYQIVQGPGYVAIRYEMVHETRLIPLGGRPHVGPAIRQYMGDPRGRWDGDVLVVETTNFTDKTDYPGPADHLRLIERFRPLDLETVEWAVTFDDPYTWARPWTFAMNLTKKDDSQQPFEYACHEGNYALRDILSGARAENAADSSQSAQGSETALGRINRPLP